MSEEVINEEEKLQKEEKLLKEELLKEECISRFKCRVTENLPISFDYNKCKNIDVDNRSYNNGMSYEKIIVVKAYFDTFHIRYTEFSIRKDRPYFIEIIAKRFKSLLHCGFCPARIFVDGNYKYEEYFEDGKKIHNPMLKDADKRTYYDNFKFVFGVVTLNYT